MSFAELVAIAAKLNELRKVDPEQFKRIAAKVEAVAADVKAAMADGKLSTAEALTVAADGLLGIEAALRLAITILK